MCPPERNGRQERQMEKNWREGRRQVAQVTCHRRRLRKMAGGRCSLPVPDDDVIDLVGHKDLQTQTDEAAEDDQT